MADEVILVQTPPDKALRMELTRRDSLYLLTGISLVPVEAVQPPQPPQPSGSPCLDRTAGRLVKRDLGTIKGDAPFSFLDAGGDARYDYRGTVRSVRYGSQWEGTRSLFMVDGGKHANANHDGACVTGGAWACPDMRASAPNWDDCYQSGNSPTGAMHFRKCKMKDFLIEAVRIHGGFDGFQTGKDSGGSNALIRWACMTMMRDDAIEDDGRWNLTVEQSLVEGFVGVSSRNPDSDGKGKTISVRGCVTRLVPMMFEGAMTTGTLFKLDPRAPVINASDNVWAAEGPPHRTIGGAFGDLLKHGKVGKFERNVFCWLGKGSNPHQVPSGVDVLEGAEAQTAWDAARRKWWEAAPAALHRLPGDPPVQAA